MRDGGPGSLTALLTWLSHVLPCAVQYEGALEWYSRAVGMQPNYAEAHCNMGVIYKVGSACWSRLGEHPACWLGSAHPAADREPGKKRKRRRRGRKAARVAATRTCC